MHAGHTCAFTFVLEHEGTGALYIFKNYYLFFFKLFFLDRLFNFLKYILIISAITGDEKHSFVIAWAVIGTLY